MATGQAGRTWRIAGAAGGMLGVLAGAFGAHALKPYLTERMYQAFQTATEYQMVHSLLLVGLAVMIDQAPEQRLYRRSAQFVLTGLLLFCGSLYLLVLTDFRPVAFVTPVGGICFMAGWGLLLAAALATDDD